MADQDNEYLGPLIELLMGQDCLDQEQADSILANHAESGKSIRSIIIDHAFVSEDELLEVMANYMGTRVVNLPALDIPQDIRQRVPPRVARMYNVVPVSMTDSSVELAVSDVFDPQISDELMFVLTGDVSVVFARDEDVRSCINQFYGDSGEAVAEMLESLEHEIEGVEALAIGDDEDELGVEEAAGSTPVIRFVNLVIYQAVSGRGLYAGDSVCQPGDLSGGFRPRLRHPLRALREGIQDSHPDRRGAL